VGKGGRRQPQQCPAFASTAFTTGEPSLVFHSRVLDSLFWPFGEPFGTLAGLWFLTSMYDERSSSKRNFSISIPSWDPISRSQPHQFCLPEIAAHPPHFGTFRIEAMAFVLSASGGIAASQPRIDKIPSSGPERQDTALIEGRPWTLSVTRYSVC